MAAKGKQALLLWCQRCTEGYPGVKVENFHTSWADGLAFCALIHRFAPEAINFHSLSKENAFQNNELAFQTAERLGIPALLDAEDMLISPRPEQLSVITYLSQFYHKFAARSTATLSNAQAQAAQAKTQMQQQLTKDKEAEDERKRLASEKKELEQRQLLEQKNKEAEQRQRLEQERKEAEQRKRIEQQQREEEKERQRLEQQRRENERRQRHEQERKEAEYRQQLEQQRKEAEIRQRQQQEMESKRRMEQERQRQHEEEERRRQEARTRAAEEQLRREKAEQAKRKEEEETLKLREERKREELDRQRRIEEQRRKNEEKRQQEKIQRQQQLEEQRLLELGKQSTTASHNNPMLKMPSSSQETRMSSAVSHANTIDEERRKMEQAETTLLQRKPAQSTNQEDKVHDATRAEWLQKVAQMKERKQEAKAQDPRTHESLDSSLNAGSLLPTRHLVSHESKVKDKPRPSDSTKLKQATKPLPPKPQPAIVVETESSLPPLQKNDTTFEALSQADKIASRVHQQRNEQQAKEKPLCGYLMKKGDLGAIRTWKRRWFLLKNERLYYFKDQQQCNEGADPYGFISLKFVSSIRQSQGSRIVLPNRNYAFQINTVERPYFLQAPDQATMDMWIHGLSRVKEQLAQEEEPPLNAQIHPGIPIFYKDLEPLCANLQRLAGTITRTWKSRWFVLKDGILFCFKREGAARPEKFPLYHCQLEDFAELPCCFKVVTKLKSVVMRFPTDEDMIQWQNTVLKHKIIIEAVIDGITEVDV